MYYLTLHGVADHVYPSPLETAIGRMDLLQEGQIVRRLRIPLLCIHKTGFLQLLMVSSCRSNVLISSFTRLAMTAVCPYYYGRTSPQQFWDCGQVSLRLRKPGKASRRLDFDACLFVVLQYGCL